MKREINTSDQKRHVFPDPIAGTIELPIWLVKIKDEPAIRRMLFIRQLGLKAYVDFPGAIHTRYSHALGAMYLAEKIAALLIKKMSDKGRTTMAESLQLNKAGLMAAGFLHDIAHGPFSHAVDFAMKKITGKSHQDLAEDIIIDTLPSDLGNWIDKRQVIKLIRGKHDYPFLSQIIDGPIDIDKLDYLLRDAHHVGLKYSFDLDYFLGSYTILGDENHPNKCKLGLENTQHAIVTAELFLVIWKSMYDLVYHAQNSRIAEKMLEKAILLNKDNNDIITKFKDINNFSELYDDNLLTFLRNSGGKCAELINSIKTNKIYGVKSDIELNQDNFQMSPKFLASLNDEDEVSDHLSVELNKRLGQEDYQYICDIVASKAPSEIQIDDVDKETGEYLDLRKKSNIVGAIQSLRRLKIYANPTLSPVASGQVINNTIKEIIEGL